MGKLTLEQLEEICPRLPEQMRNCVYTAKRRVVNDDDDGWFLKWTYECMRMQEWVEAEFDMRGEKGGAGYMKIIEPYVCICTLDQYSYLNKAPLRASSTIGKQ